MGRVEDLEAELLQRDEEQTLLEEDNLGLIEEVDKLQTENAELKKQLEKSSGTTGADLADLQDKVDLLQAALDDANAKRVQSEQFNEQLEGELRNYQGCAQINEDKLANAIASAEYCRAELEEAAEQRKTEAIEASADLRRSQERITELEDEVAILKSAAISERDHHDGDVSMNEAPVASGNYGDALTVVHHMIETLNRVDESVRKVKQSFSSKPFVPTV
eukprot:TRINITY_DN27444_c0_g1_i1.p1 TRINITY_DN27444_c0_g1~~TRINITY_DN27444_c0_g1_i1.p1  ORF type:complete len:220 (-),score=46.12 TRINITY_DN27444_c0_g1_i1:245-904(-)